MRAGSNSSLEGAPNDPSICQTIATARITGMAIGSLDALNRREGLSGKRVNGSVERKLTERFEKTLSSPPHGTFGHF
jgi:hypothetical protein